MIESIVMLNTTCNIVTSGFLGYLCYKVFVNRQAINTFPDPYMVFDEMMKQRIPILTGPDGRPILPDMGEQKKEKNPLVG